MVPPTSLPYSEGFDSPSKASPASSTSSTSLGARSALCLHLSASPMLLQQFPQPCWTAFWSASLEDCSAPVPAPTLYLPEPESSHQQHCVDLLRARWALLLPCCLPPTATHEDVRPAAALGCCCCVDSSTSHEETATALVVLCLVHILCMLPSSTKTAFPEQRQRDACSAIPVWLYQALLQTAYSRLHTLPHLEHHAFWEGGSSLYCLGCSCNCSWWYHKIRPCCHHCTALRHLRPHTAAASIKGSGPHVATVGAIAVVPASPAAHKHTEPKAPAALRLQVRQRQMPKSSPRRGHASA